MRIFPRITCQKSESEAELIHEGRMIMEEKLIPLYKKEFYLAYLCGEDVTLPEPEGNTERYLAYLCGMDVALPDPEGNKEHYLAYLCGMDVEIPAPLYRKEFYLAKWCGMDVETPKPLYRAEHWLAILADQAANAAGNE